MTEHQVLMIVSNDAKEVSWYMLALKNERWDVHVFTSAEDALSKLPKYDFKANLFLVDLDVEPRADRMDCIRFMEKVVEEGLAPGAKFVIVNRGTIDSVAKNIMGRVQVNILPKSLSSEVKEVKEMVESILH